MREEVSKKVMFDSYSVWSGRDGKTFMSFVVDHETHNIVFDYEGIDPCIEDFINVCLKDRDILEEMIWGINAPRANFAFIREREGMSGCRDYSLCFTDRNGNEASMMLRGNEAFTLHISGYGKVQPRFKIWAGDLAPLLWHLKPFRKKKNQVIFVIFENNTIVDEYKNKMRFKYIKPQNVQLCPLERIRGSFNSLSGLTPDGNERPRIERRPRRPRRPREETEE